MFPYVICTPNFTESSGGIVVLHQLCWELIKKGQEAYVSCPVANPKWNTPSWANHLLRFIAVYPEISTGNELGNQPTVRWLLTFPGYRGGPLKYNSNELIFLHQNKLNLWNLPKERILHLPLDPSPYFDRKEKRSGEVFFVGKAVNVKLPQGALEIKKEQTGDKKFLVNILNKAGVLYCFDNLTAMHDIARLCGCPVVIIPDGTISKKTLEESEQAIDGHLSGIGFGLEEEKMARDTIDSDKTRKHLIKLKRKFLDSLDCFIELTQEFASQAL